MASSRRDLIYRMTADPQGFKKGMEAAGQSSRGFYKELRKLEEQQAAVDEVMAAGGSALLAFGTATGIGLALAAKAAIEWESAWTGVSKVVDGSPEQLAALETELRDLATTLPQTHAEIAGVAAAAGQLGIAREDIVGFTETMVAMGVSTNLASADAATALARMMNIMSTAPEDVDKLGSAIVGLGNTSATTEAEIVEMALRIAGAGETVGMSEADVLGFAAALSSVGIEAESGGSSISVAMVKIAEAVNKGGDSLEGFAEVAGVSAQTFAAQFRDDPAAAIDSFVQGLGRIQSSGGDVFGTMEALGLSEIRLRDAFLRLANAGDLLNESLATGRQEWNANSALMEEASRRYGTTEAQMQLARNQLVDVGITLGETLLPALQTMLDAGGGFLSFFQDLPDPVKQTVVWLGLGATAIGLLGGAALIAAPKLHALNVALLEIGTRRASVAQKALSGVTRVLTGPWGLALGAAVTVLGAFVGSQAASRARTEELSATLDEQTSAVTGNTKAWIANELEQEGALKLAQSMGIDLTTLVDAIAGEADALAEVNAVLDTYMSSGEDAATYTQGMATSVQRLTGDGAELNTVFQDLTGRLDDATAAHQRKNKATEDGSAATTEASGTEQVLAEQLGITTEAATIAADGFSTLDEKVRALIDSAFQLSGAQRDVEAGIDDLTEKLAENGNTFDINTQAGRDNEAAVEALVQDVANLAIATAEETGSAEDANAVLATQKDRLRDVLEQTGLTEDQIDDYIGVLDDIPSEIETIVEANININTTERINRIIVEEFGTSANTIVEREGGVVYHARQGLLRDAGIFSPVFPARFAFAEMETGGEAFIPRLGDRDRSLGILQEAAAWHRASVVPDEIGMGGGGQVINVNLRSYSKEFSTQQVLDDLKMRSAA